jgi:hypothetical protein
LCSLLLWWGFSVDDALISCRVASNLHHGLGYRFNATGPMVDAVTPLGWAPLLAPFATSTLSALRVARFLGAAAWLIAGGVLGVQIAAVGEHSRRFQALIVLALCAPLGAWASAGMETGLVIALCTAALTGHRLATVALYCAVLFRPELLPWAFTLQVGWALTRKAPPRSVLLAGLGPCVVFVVVAAIRQMAFGAAAPLGFIAKPTTWQDGVSYCWGVVRLSGPPFLLFAWNGWRKVAARQRVIAVACAVHLATLVAVGGDWMPFFRLAAPVLPAALLVGAALAEHASLVKNSLRLGLAVLASGALVFTRWESARGVMDQRAALIASLQRIAKDSDRIATLDVGWVGASSKATVLDLAGVTDPVVARWTGGHTSKHLPDDYLERFDPTLVVLLTAPNAPIRSPWTSTEFQRVVERRLAALCTSQGITLAPIAELPLVGTAQSYLVVRPAPIR